MATAISFNASELSALGAHFSGMADGEVIKMAGPHFRKIGTAILIKSRTHINSKSGTLSKGGRSDVTMQARGINLRVGFRAVNAGHNYAPDVHDGRPGFGPKTKKALAFEVGGQKIVRARVGPAKANPYLTRGFDESQGTIDAELTALESELAKKLESF